MTWYRTLIENGALQRCKTEQEREELMAGFADHLRDEWKDEALSERKENLHEAEGEC